MSEFSCKVVLAEKVADNVIHLGLQRPADFHWKTGAFALLGLDVNGEKLCRAYSIASVGDSDVIEFFIARVKDGTVSPRMHELKTGDTVFLQGDTDGMLYADRLEKGGRDLWLFATGTGVAPFMAVCADDSITSQYENIILVHGVRNWNETEYVSRLVHKSPKLRLVCSVTRENTAHIKARIPDALDSGEIEKSAGFILNKETSRAMLCGNPAMVKGVREFLKSRQMVSPRGGNPGQVLVENFWL